ncbi:MAG: dephospho-CoA kinase [Aaplasma endosymbiont of Hyalomma asiaticum]
MLILGLSGGAAVGKSTVARLFSKFSNAAVFDADKEVHHMYESDERVIAAIREFFPDAVIEGHVSRKQLSRHFFEDSKRWHEFQSVIHGCVLQKQKRFILDSRRTGIRLLVLDIPLLLEKGFWRDCNVIVHVYANPRVQLERLRSREISEEHIRFLLSKQVNSVKRCSFADFFINTCSCTKDISYSVLDIIRYGLSGASFARFLNKATSPEISRYLYKGV